MEFILNTVRKLDNDQAREYLFGDNESLRDKLAIAFLNPDDLKELHIKIDSHIKISNQNGSIVVKCTNDDKIPPKMIIMPVSLWANQLTNSDNDNLQFKNISIKIEPTEEKILNYDDLLQMLREG